MQLAQTQLVGLREQLVDPVAGRVHLEPVAGLGGDERALPRVVLDLQAEVGRALERLGEAVVVERDADVVDARDAPSGPAGGRR